MKMILALLLTCTAFAGGFAAEFADISKDDLAKAIEAKAVVVLDVNGTDSYKAGHIPGAIDFAAKKDELAKLLPSDKATLIVAYCGGPACGAWKSGAEAVAALGYTNVKHLKVGIKGWKDAGANLETVQ